MKFSHEFNYRHSRFISYLFTIHSQGLLHFTTHGIHFNHDSRNSFLSNHDSQSTKKPDHGVTKMPLPPFFHACSRFSGSLRNLYVWHHNVFFWNFFTHSTNCFLFRSVRTVFSGIDYGMWDQRRLKDQLIREAGICHLHTLWMLNKLMIEYRDCAWFLLK